MTTSKQTIVVQRSYGASAERVFDTWLDPGRAGKFLFATPTGQMVRVEIDPRVGGRLLFVDRRDGKDVEHSGSYLVIERPTRLVFAFRVPTYSDDETRVDLELERQGDGCQLTLRQSLPVEAAQRSKAGWTTVLDNLAPLVEGQGPGK